ncbi:DUF6261 family protein [uncultured Acetobacteroides sp.]|uniref:DUF6261 family protein n=1 Tax=uncultured Acetobacteroides sp. TaxID=1760811 RepID=UPI0029F482A3|nr:DUF6261 family protein [uncultured Acetobacteroides sp.]
MAKFQTFLRSCLLDSLMGYASRLDYILISAKLDELSASKIYQTFRYSLTKMEEGYMQSQKNPFTEALGDIVLRRSRTFKSIHHVIQSYLYSDVDAEREAAQKLLLLFKRYKAEFSKTSSRGVTGIVSSFIEDVKQPDYADAVATLLLNAKLQQLLRNQTEYEEVFLKSIATDVESSKTVVASSIRKAFTMEMRDLLLFVGTKAKEYPDSKWSELNGQIAIHNTKFVKGEGLRQAALKKKRESKKGKE